MIQLERSALLPYPASHAYAVVADIERYPEFIPGCSNAHVEAIQSDRVTALLGFKVKGLEDAFCTQNNLVLNERIEMHLLRGPFRQLDGRWEFLALSDSGCKVTLHLQLDFGNRVLSKTLGPWVERAAAQIVDAFVQRVRALDH